MHSAPEISDPLTQAAIMDVVAQIYASMRSGNVADFLAKLSGGYSSL